MLLDYDFNSIHAKPLCCQLRFLFCSIALFSILLTSSAEDTITANQTLRDGDTIVSAGKNFELGFFSPGNSTNRYLGIWYKISNGTVVWVANREIPLTNKASGVLKFITEGILVLLNGTNGIIWSSNTSGSIRNPVARLLDTGNLVIRDGNDSDPENFIWQSFDYPCDTLLPGMKLGKEFATSTERYLTSWKSVNDPSIGDYKVWVESNGYPQVLAGRHSEISSRLGVWNGLWFGIIGLRPNSDYTTTFAFTKKEIYYKYEVNDKSVVSRMILTPDGSVYRLNWRDGHGWLVNYGAPEDQCDLYAMCGPQGSCQINDSPLCRCVTGFVPKYPQEWRVANWSAGCCRKVALNCDGDVFQKYVGMRLPDTRFSWFDDSISKNLEDCEMMCKNNCNCTGYTNSFIRRGCVLWFGDLIDIKEDQVNGQDIYIRMAASESAAGSTEENSRDRQVRTIIIVVPVVTVILLAMCLLYVFRLRKLKRKGKMGQYYTDQSQKHDLELPLFGLSTLLDATDNFSSDNKLGEGGFGTVYKGLLEDGREIAVKRLSKTSSQGLDEFMNEVTCISKLQHRNLVKLLGCSIQGDEKMLVYEYMPNKSLDSLIFDKTQHKILDWRNRFQIVNGIARGLLYLHQDSRLRIIHRDLKAGNILLDHDMNPKISDFGLARSIRGTETEANTNKVVGTYGYMSPEYAGHGLFSMKSDVFSFGVIVLEIVSGKKNRGFSYQDHHHNLLGYAWRLHEDGKSLELADPFINVSSVECEVLRSIQVGLLCVQQRPEDRPSMSSVVLMLSSEIELPQPKKPGFFTESNIVEVDVEPPSVNQVTISLLNGR